MLTQDSEPAVTLPAAAVAASADTENIALTPPGAAPQPATLTPAVAAATTTVGSGYIAPEVAAASVPPQVADNAPAAVAGEATEAAEEEGELGMLPLESEPTGALGLAAKMLKAKTSELAESERVKQATSFIKEKATNVAENEKVQQSVAFVKTKAGEIAESERVRKSVDYAKEKAAAASVSFGEASEKVSEKTKAGVEYAKEKTAGAREGLGKVWESGRGSIQRVRSNLADVRAWKGSARDTLDIAAREEQWKGIKIQGAEELTVPARTEHTCCYHVSRGSTLRWTFRVKDNDIGFGVRMRVQEWGGSREDEVLATDRYDSSDTISGSWVADEDRTMVLVFDNKYSKLRSKTVAYFTGTEKPPVFVESPNVEAVTDPLPAAVAEAPAVPAAPVAAASAAAPVAAEATAAPRPIV